MSKKPHKRNGRAARERRREAAKDRADKSRKLLKKIFEKQSLLDVN